MCIDFGWGRDWGASIEHNRVTCLSLRRVHSLTPSVRARRILRASFGPAFLALVSTCLSGNVSAFDQSDWRLLGVERSNSPHLHGLNCQSKITVMGSTTVDPKDAGRVAIAAWAREVNSTYGVEFSNFKRAKEPIVHCRQLGNNLVQNCAISGYPCVGAGI
jgi:hypothetical protein